MPDMKGRRNFGKCRYLANLIVGLVTRNKATFICFIVAMIFALLSTKLQFETQTVSTKVENYISRQMSGGDEPMELFARFVIFPISHYLFELVHKLIFVYALQSLLGELSHFNFEEYISISHPDFHRLGSGEIHALVERRTFGASCLVYNLFGDMLSNVFYLFWGLRHFLQYSKGVVLLALVQILVFFWATCCSIRIKTHLKKKWNRSSNMASNKLYGILQQYDVMKAYNKEGIELSKYRRCLELVARDSRNYLQMEYLVGFFQRILLFLPNAFLVFGVMSGYLFGSMRVDDAYRNYAKFSFGLCTQVMSLNYKIFAINENLIDIFDSRIEDASPDDKNTGVPVDGFDGFRFEDVSIRVGNVPVVRSFSGEIRRGEKIAIIGENGCGKSSLVNMLLRFLEYDGKIIVNGRDLRCYQKSSVRSLISLVPQVQHFFDGSVLENIAYSQSKIDYEDVLAKCRWFNTYETFSRLADGFQTRVGENGRFLSEGQKQRISFMRAMVKDTDVVLLDEPTSSLDTDAEQEIVRMILGKMGSKTVLLVVHNHSLLKGFDRIFEFSGGTIIVHDSFDKFLSSRSRQEQHTMDGCL